MPGMWRAVGRTMRAGVARPSATPDSGMSDLEPIIERALRRFLAHVRDVGWHGRENEAVSLYAFGFLQRECVPGGPLVDATQIGIEVGAAPAPVKGPRARVRKDLVIWP